MNAEQRLSNVLSEFARTLVTDFPIQAILDHLVVRIVDVLPISAAGVTLIAPGAEPHYVAASDDSALRFEQLQTELGEGPCLAAYLTGEAVSVPDLSVETRFPRFAGRAIEEGLVAVFTFPMHHGAMQLGALDLYSTTAGPMDDAAMAAAQTLADVAAAYLINAQARAELEATMERTRQVSLHDALTGLANRTLLVQLLDHALLSCRRSHRMVGVLFADLDDFKTINDMYGHDTGDELLVAVGTRLSHVVRPGDTVGRLSGDEFVILCEDLEDECQIEPVADRIGAAMDEPFALSSGPVSVTASVGIAFSGRGGASSDDIIREADAAMYQAKRRGGARHAIIDVRERRVMNERAGLTRDLRAALARGDLHLAYQPIVTTAEGAVVGCEALLRWVHPKQGLVPPETTIVLAEQAGIVPEIGGWVLKRACIDRRRWTQRGGGLLPVSVNVSADELMGPGYAHTVAAILADTNTPADQVTLELTEGVFVADAERALVVLRGLKDIGVRVALDDFGTGYSSLSYLNRFPVDIVKIDQSFVAGLTGHESATRLIVGAVAGLAHGLGMTVVAEGVETEQQHAEVAKLGCEYSQGFYFARPMTASALETLLAVHDGGDVADRPHLPLADHVRRP